MCVHPALGRARLQGCHCGCPSQRFFWIPPGGTVHLVCRDPSRAEGARAEIMEESGNQVSGCAPPVGASCPRGTAVRGRDSWPRSCTRAGRALFRLLLGRRPQPSELEPRFSKAGPDLGDGAVTPTPPVKACLGDMTQTGPCRGPSPKKEAASLRHVQGTQGEPSCKPARWPSDKEGPQMTFRP